MRYKQCRLKRNRTFRYSWIPEKYAIKGKILRINESEGWYVEEVYATASEEDVIGNERMHKRWAAGRGL